MFVPVLLTFIAVFLLIATISLGVSTIRESPAFVLKSRLRRLAVTQENSGLSDDIRKEIIKETPSAELVLAKFRLFNKLDALINQAGLKVQLVNFLLYSITITVVPAIALYMYYRSFIYSLPVLILVPLIILIILKVKKNNREIQFTEQLPDVLMMISRSLRAGHSLTSAIELVGLEVTNPAGELFKIAYEQQKLGMRITDSLANMTNHIASLDLRFFIISVSINSEIGGNLAEILDKLALTIRDRLKVRRQVRVYTAQGRMSGYVLAALPIIVFVSFSIINPDYEKLLITEKTGNYLLILAIVMQFIGFMFIRKIINIRI